MTPKTLSRIPWKTGESNWQQEKINFGGVKIQRGIFQGVVLSPFLFVITIMPFNQILRKLTGGFKLHKLQEKINHIMYMDDIRLLTKNKKELENLI